MTHLVISTDASALPDNTVGIGYVVERVSDDGQQVEMLVKDCEDVSSECSGKHHERISEGEFLAIIHGVAAARDYVGDDESVIVRCDRDHLVTRIQRDDLLSDERRERIEDVFDGIDWEIRNIPRIVNSLADSLSKQASRDKIR